MTATAEKAPPRSVAQVVWRSFTSALGSIVFGMEDGTVSIFGLVFGVAASASNSQAVLLAGATGAIAAAVSMMAGTYLDVSTERDRAKAALASERRRFEQEPQVLAQDVHNRLTLAGFTSGDAATVLTVLERTPGALLKTESALEQESGLSADQNPLVQAIWMFIADLFAASVPVLPFALLPIQNARVVSLVVTAILLLLLGIGRGVIGHRNVIVTALQTLAIAAAAAGAGLVVGALVSGQLGG